jgi:hypothetical protein
MATTTNYSWSTPDDTALVKDGAAAIRSLGTAIDTTVFTNAGAAIAKTIVDAKGDIIAATAADTVSRLAVGANNTVLTADSSTATGLKWGAAAAGFDPFLMAKVTGNYLTPSFLSAVADSRSSTEDVTIYTPVFIPAGTFDRIAMRSGSTHTGTGTIRLGLYNMDSTTFRPSTLVFDAGTVSVDASYTNFEITINQTITKGYYYFAFNVQNSTGNTRFYGHGGGVPVGTTLGGNIASTFDENAVQASQKGFKETGVTGAFTTAGTLTQSNDPVPLIGMRFA